MDLILFLVVGLVVGAYIGHRFRDLVTVLSVTWRSGLLQRTFWVDGDAEEKCDDVVELVWSYDNVLRWMRRGDAFGHRAFHVARAFNKSVEALHEDIVKKDVHRTIDKLKKDGFFRDHKE